MNKYVKFLLIILAILVVMIIILAVRKGIILNKCAKELEEENYYMKRTTYSYDYIETAEKYCNYQKSLLILKDEEHTITVYKDDSYVRAIAEKDGIKTRFETGENYIDINLNQKGMKEFSVFNTKISSEKCNGKDCYLLEKKDGTKMWIEKDTNLMIRKIEIVEYNNKEVNSVSDYEYEINTVTDEKIVEPQV